MKVLSKQKKFKDQKWGRGTIGRKLCPTTPVGIKIPVHVSTNALAVTMWGAAFSPQPILWKETHKPSSGKNAEKGNVPPHLVVNCDFPHLYSPLLVKTKEDSKTTVCLPARLGDKRKCCVGSEVIAFWFQWNLDCGRRAEDIEFGQACEFRSTNPTFCGQRCRNSKHRISVWGVQFQDENYTLTTHNDNSHK